MELPNSKTLPYYIIAILLSTVTGLAGYTVKRDADCASERKEVEAKYDACQSEIREVYKRQTAYLQKQDSINRENSRVIEKIKRKK